MVQQEGLLELPKQQQWTKEHVDLLKNGVVGPVTKEVENAELLNSFFLLFLYWQGLLSGLLDLCA